MSLKMQKKFFVSKIGQNWYFARALASQSQFDFWLENRSKRANRSKSSRKLFFGLTIDKISFRLENKPVKNLVSQNYLESFDVLVRSGSQNFGNDVIVGISDPLHGFSQASAIVLHRSQKHTLENMSQFVTFNLEFKI